MLTELDSTYSQQSPSESSSKKPINNKPLQAAKISSIKSASKAETRLVYNSLSLTTVSFVYLGIGLYLFLCVWFV
jgi:hypothetical protein